MLGAYALAFSHAPVLRFLWCQGTSQDPRFSLGNVFCKKLPANFLPRKPGRKEARSSTTKSPQDCALGKEEPSSQGTTQGERRGKIRPEISQKLGEQDIPAAVAVWREPGEGRAFRTAGHCGSSVYGFHTDGCKCL